MSDEINSPDQAMAEPSPDAAGDQEAQLKAARELADSHYRSWQRTAADFANFKRRIDDDKRFVERWLLQDLLPVLDDFDRAWATLPLDLRKLSWIEGLFQVNSRLFSTLQRHGVTPIEALDREFSPVEHEAVLRDEEVDPADQTVVVAELQRGYKLHERVLRATLVKVGRKPAEAASSETPDAVREVPAFEANS
jgi:molecular chaperone GrpE